MFIIEVQNNYELTGFVKDIDTITVHIEQAIRFTSIQEAESFLKINKYTNLKIKIYNYANKYN